MNNVVFGKTMENARKHRDIKLVTTDKRRNQLVSEPNYHAIKGISENLVAIEMKGTKVKMKKPVYIGLSILDSFIIYLKTEDFYEDIAYDAEKRFHTSNYDVDRPLPKGKNKKAIGLMKDELGGKFMTEFVALRPKTYSYLMDDDSESKKANGAKKCVIKKVFKFNDYKDCFLNNEIILKLKQRFKSESLNTCTEEINETALSSNDNKRYLYFDGIYTHPLGTDAFMVSKSALDHYLKHKKMKSY